MLFLKIFLLRKTFSQTDLFLFSSNGKLEKRTIWEGEQGITYEPEVTVVINMMPFLF